MTTEIKATFKLEQTTSGALRYREVDPDGEFYPQPNSPGCKIGTIYLRKSVTINGHHPKEITVLIHYDESTT